jgi:hypothetical protein
MCNKKVKDKRREGVANSRRTEKGWGEERGGPEEVTGDVRSRDFGGDVDLE